jgi:glyoxylase-like metal-dependent hydrolase (beta-lactamase superfamily II)
MTARLKCIRAANPGPMTLDGTWTYIVGWERPLVIDPGPDLPAHLERIMEELAGRAPIAIALTHRHADHAAGAPALAQRTGSEVWLGAGGPTVPQGPAELVTRLLTGDEVIETDAGSVRVVSTPGHSPEHLCLLWKGAGEGDRRALFVGDLLMGEGDTTLVAAPEGDVSLYLRSLEIVESLRPSVLYPAHGPPLRDPPEAVGRFRRHRLERIEAVRRLLRADPTADEETLLLQVYGGALDPALVRPARGSLRAVLAYLGSLEDGGEVGSLRPESRVVR